MKIQYFATIPLQSDEPVGCIKQFVDVLRTCTTDTGKAEVDLNLIGVSARARATIQEFEPHRTKGVPFPEALVTTEALTILSPAKIKSLHFMMSAEGFRWRGSIPSSSGRLALLDGKSFQRKQRFHLSALLSLNASRSEEESIERMLAEIAKETGIRFEREARVAAFEAEDPGRATPEQLLVTGLAWNELLETVGKRVRQEISLQNIPHLMTTYQAHDFLFDPAKQGKSVRVDFSRTVRKWLKDTFPDYKPSANPADGEVRHKELAEGVEATLHVDKRPRALSKEFTIWLGIAMTSPRFAPTSQQPLRFPANLFHFFGIGPLPIQWTYHTESDLREALEGCAAITKSVLAVFEPEALKMKNAYSRSLEEFPGLRELSAREAYQMALPQVTTWAEDRALIRVGAGSVVGSYLPDPDARMILPVLNGEGRLATSGAWIFTLHSRKKGENLHIKVPYRGSITMTLCDAPGGRHYPSDADQIVREGWIDSGEALWLARAKAPEIFHDAEEPQLFELSSRANVLASWPTLPLPLRDGMFKMETSWQISFDRRQEDSRSIANITVPAYGGAEPKAEMHTYDKHGRPTKG